MTPGAEGEILGCFWDCSRDLLGICLQRLVGPRPVNGEYPEETLEQDEV